MSAFHPTYIIFLSGAPSYPVPSANPFILPLRLLVNQHGCRPPGAEINAPVAEYAVVLLPYPAVRKFKILHRASLNTQAAPRTVLIRGKSAAPFLLYPGKCHILRFSQDSGKEMPSALF